MAERIRYAVVGLGHISQVAILPAFDHAENSELAAIVSGDETKLKELGDRHQVERRVTYDQYDELMASGDIDAVYIATPNNLHRDYAVRAAQAGVHILCEKPLARTEDECRAMIHAADQHDVELMTAYRLHFEEANMKAVELAHDGTLGHVRLFESIFTQDVKAGDMRLDFHKGGGTLHDQGIYCINAARYLFRAEPTSVFARSASRDDERFREVDEMTAVTLAFPDDRLATFISSFGASFTSSYRVVGTKGSLRMEPAYEYAKPLAFETNIDGETEQHTFEKRDQFAPQLVYFSECILDSRPPEPDGREGLVDVRIIEAAYRSAAEGRPMPLGGFPPRSRPGIEQVINKPPVEDKPAEIHASGPKR